VAGLQALRTICRPEHIESGLQGDLEAGLQGRTMPRGPKFVNKLVNFRRVDDKGEALAFKETLSFLFRPFELKNASLHPLFRPVRHDSPRREDLKPVAIHLEETCLFGTDPFRIPGNFDLGNPLVPF